MALVYDKKKIKDVYYGNRRVENMYCGSRLIHTIHRNALYGFGDNQYGKAGQDSSRSIISSPELINDTNHWRYVLSGYFNFFAIDSNNDLYACGDIAPLSINGKSVIPLTKVGDLKCKLIAGKDLYNRALITEDGKLYVSGHNGGGALGLGSSGYAFPTFTRVGSESNWVYVGLTSSHMVAINSLGEMYSCGKNDRGQLGLGYISETPDTYPRILTKVPGKSNWKKVWCQQNMSIALDADGKLYHCGSLYSTGSANNDTDTMTQIELESNWEKVSVNGKNIAAINKDGELFVLGDNTYGQLGLGGVNNTTCFTSVRHDLKWVDVSLGVRHMVAINSLGEMYSCGSAHYMGIGYELQSEKYITSLTRIGTSNTWIAADSYHGATIALKFKDT